MYNDSFCRENSTDEAVKMAFRGYTLQKFFGFLIFPLLMLAITYLSVSTKPDSLEGLFFDLFGLSAARLNKIVSMIDNTINKPTNVIEIAKAPF